MNKNISQAIFGAFDGLNCVLGLIIAGSIANDVHALLLSTVGLSIAAGFSMFGGSYLSELVDIHKIQHATVIGSASCAGILLPIIPFLFFPRTQATIVAICIVLLLTGVIAQLRVSTLGALKAYTQTYLVTIGACLLPLVIVFFLNGGHV